jgi:hypothetical protein
LSRRVNRSVGSRTWSVLLSVLASTPTWATPAEVEFSVPASAPTTRAPFDGSNLAPGVDSVVALGDSLLAGFASGGLVESVQRSSIAARLAQALAASGSALSAFEQPLVSEPGIPPLLELVDISPLTIVRRPGAGQPLNGDLDRPFDNLAVPGFEVGDALRTPSGNPLAELVLRGRGTMLEQALERDADLVLVWLGNSDALSALTSGVVIEGVTLTPLDAFRADLRELVASLTGSGARVVLLELPTRFDEAPFVTYLAPVVTDLDTGYPVLDHGETVPLLGPDGPLGSDDRVLMTAIAPLRSGLGIPAAHGGTDTPLPNTVVLSAAERAAIRARLDDYNREIRSAARDFGALVSAEPARAFDDAAAHWREAGCPVGAEAQPFGRLFSLDSIHPSAQGYGVLANALLEDLRPWTGALPITQTEELCLGGRFVATARWTAAEGEAGTGHPVSVSGDSGHFWFFDRANVELTVKVLDGCGVTNSFWVFAGGLTDLGVELEVTDTSTGASRIYESAPGSPFAPVVDIAAFATCDEP